MSLVTLGQSPQDYKSLVSSRNVPDFTLLPLNCVLPSADTADGIVSVWDATTPAVWAPLSANSTMTVVSSSANDDSAGSGAQTLVIQGLTQNGTTNKWVSQTAVVIMDGTTPVVTTETFIRINKVIVATVGAGGVAAGNITITSTAGASLQATIIAGQNVSRNGNYSTANDQKALLYGFTASAYPDATLGGSRGAIIFGYITNEFISVPFQEIIQFGLDDTSTITVPIQFQVPYLISQQSDIFFRTQVLANATRVSLQLNMSLQRTAEIV